MFRLCGPLLLSALILVAGAGLSAWAGELVVNCFDEARDTVQSKLVGDCKGKAVSDAEAEVIKERRRAYIKRALNKPAMPATKGKRLRGIGSGFFVAADGSLVTNNHVIRDCALVTVASASGERGSATAVVPDPAHDLALLRTDLAPQGIANLAAITLIDPRGPVALVGYPSRGMAPINPALTAGTFRGIQQGGSGARVMVIQADVRKGNSGGPLLDAEGKVIGVTFAKVNTVRVFEKTGSLINDIGFAIPVELVLDLLDSHGVAYRMEKSPQRNFNPTALLNEARPYMARIGCWR